MLHRLNGEYEQAEECLNQALDQFEALETRWQFGRTLYELGELALNLENREKARGNYSFALAVFDKIGAKPDSV